MSAAQPLPTNNSSKRGRTKPTAGLGSWGFMSKERLQRIVEPRPSGSGLDRSLTVVALRALHLGGDSQHDVELSLQLTDFRVLHLGEVDRHRVALFAIADGLVDEVLLVVGLALDVALRDQQLLAAALDLDVDVRSRPAG